MKKVGEGNFASVFMAEDLWTKSAETQGVALKIFNVASEDVGRAVFKHVVNLRVILISIGI